VTVPAMPQKQTCSEPEIYPGSKLFRSKVYDSMPEDVEVRLPTLCLSWKGVCAAYSTFEGSAVFLKTDEGKFCHVVSGTMLCDGTKGVFAFGHQEGVAPCTGSAELSSVDSNVHQACHFDQSMPAPHVSCGSAVSGGPPAEIVISANPLPTGRSGKVGFEFKGQAGQPVWRGGAPSQWYGANSWQGTISGWTLLVDTYYLDAPGGFKSIKYKYAAQTQVAIMDQVFSFQRYEGGGWLRNAKKVNEGGTEADGWQRGYRRSMSMGPARITCDPNHILVGISSTSGSTGTNYKSWRTWSWNCAPAPEGLTISGEFGPKPSQAWGESDCGPNGYVIGMEGSPCGPGPCSLSYSAQPPGSDPYGTKVPAYNKNSWSQTQVQFMCGTLSFAKPSPMQLTVEYSSALA